MQFIKQALKGAIRKVEKERTTVSNSEVQLFEEVMNDHLRKEAFEFIRQRMPTASYFPGWKEMFDYIIPNFPAGLLLEFGVAKGKTANYLAARTDRKVHGFDSFIGFPETYIGHVTSRFDFKGNIPKVRENVILHPGFFEDTLPAFVREQREENVAFIHMDCDIYSSTRTVLQFLNPKIRDTFIQFDEFFNYWCWQQHEVKAFDEYLKENADIQCEYVGFSFRQALVRLRRPKKGTV